MQQKKLITSRDYVNFQKIPSVFLFLNEAEINELLNKEENIDFLDELLENDCLEILNNIFSADKLIVENKNKIYNFVNEKLKRFLLNKFSIKFEDFYDCSKDDNSTEKTIEYIKNKESFFLYKPTIKNEAFQVKPLGIFKYQEKLYLFESFVTTTLKREVIGNFIFNEYVLKDFFKISIDNFLIIYLKKEVNDVMDLNFEITNGLPFNSKQLSPQSSFSKKLRNINTLFKKEIIPYEDSIYTFFINKEDYAFINNTSWDEYKFEYLQFCNDLKKIAEIYANPIKKFEIKTLLKELLEKEKSLIPLETTFYKLLFRDYFENYTFSDKLMPFKKLVIQLADLKTKDKQEEFLLSIKNFSKFELSETLESNYFIFKDAKKNFEEFNERKTKIYYDFETISLPFSPLYKCKPFSQSVLQMSLIKEVNGSYSTQNFLFDPQNFEIKNLKSIIDALYCEEEDAAYVVYNKSFENTRLKEMTELIRDKEYTKKIYQIINNTVDLAQWFIYGNHPHIIHKKLQGYHSIKKIIDLIPKKFLEKTKTVDYKKLESCKNGLMAQHLMISRSLNKDVNNKNDAIWEKTKNDLIKYCENDVRVMISLKLFIQDILKNKNFFYPSAAFLKLKQEKQDAN